ncbi:hypothetical protein D3C80_2070110 [compost metagenome]
MPDDIGSAINLPTGKIEAIDNHRLIEIATRNPRMEIVDCHRKRCERLVDLMRDPGCNLSQRHKLACLID